MTNENASTSLTRPRRIPKVNPRRAAPCFNRAEVHRSGGRIEAALIEYLKAVELDPANAFYRHKLGECYASAGQFALAVEALKTACKLTPEDGFYHFSLGELHARAGQPED